MLDELNAPAPDVSADRGGSLGPAWLVAAMLFAVALATGNLTGLGIGVYPLTYDTIALPRLAVMIVLATAAWAAWWWVSASRRTPLAVNVTWGILAAFGGWAALSAIASPEHWFTVLGQSERLEGLVTLVFYVVLYGLALQAVRTPLALRLVTGSFAVASTLLSVYGLMQFAGLDRANYQLENFGFTAQVAFASLGNPNFLGALLVLALPCAVALAFTMRPCARIAWGACAAIILLGLVATLTRGAWIAAGAEAIVALIVLSGYRRVLAPATAQRAARIAAVIGLVLLVAAAGLLLRPDLRRGKLSTFSGLTSRFALADVAARAMVSRPLFGYGPDSFIAAYRANRITLGQAVGEPVTQNNAHSWVMQLGATLGLLGAVLLVAAIVYGLWTSRFCLRREQARGEPLLTGVWIGCLGFSLAMLGNVAMLASTVPFWILLGALGARRVRLISVPKGSATAVATIGTLVAAAMVAAALSLVVADVRFLNSRLIFNGFQSGDVLSESSAATRLNPISIKYARSAAQVRAAIVRSAIASGSSVTSVRAQYELARAAFDRALFIDPADYPSLAWLAALQAETGVYVHDASLLSSAQQNARAAMKFDPRRSDVRALANGDVTAAAQESALEVQPLP